ncbi:MAG TPA: hypothetical protein DEP42_02650, partial [Ruminococcaceae bacterium]|nr:hypothetical protein [Oscillospiraceae bacterium]
MRKKRAKLGHNWLRGLIILVAAVVVAAIAVSKLTPMPAAELPDDAVIAEVTVTQGVDGVVTAYQAVTTDGESTQVDRGVFEQWLSHGAGKIDAADIENKPIPPNESTYWLFLFFFILALWCAVLGIQDMVPGLCGQARTAHWRKVMIGIGIAATVLGVIALIGQPCVHDGQISQEVKHRLPVSGTVKTKWAQITGYGKHERTIYLLSLWYPLGNTEIKAVQTVGASTYEHLKAG